MLAIVGRVDGSSIAQPRCMYLARGPVGGAREKTVAAASNRAEMARSIPVLRDDTSVRIGDPSQPASTIILKSNAVRVLSRLSDNVLCNAVHSSLCVVVIDALKLMALRRIEVR